MSKPLGRRLWATALLVVAPSLAAQAERGSVRVVRSQDPEARALIERRLVEVLELLESDQPSAEDRARASLRELVEHVRSEHARGSGRAHAKVEHDGDVMVVRPAEVELHADGDVRFFELERDGRVREAAEEARRFRVLRAQADGSEEVREIVEIELDEPREAPRPPRAPRAVRRAKAPEAPEAGGRGGVVGVRRDDGRAVLGRRLAERRAAEAEEAREEASRSGRARDVERRLRTGNREREAARARGHRADGADEAELRSMLEELRGEMQEVRVLMQRIRHQAEADEAERPRGVGAAGRMVR